MIRLASSSQTRAQILKNAGVEFVQESVDFDEESIIASSPKSFVYKATLGKYEANLKAFGCSDFPLLVADTVVSAHGKILRKANSIDEAREILLMQSGSLVTITTCMIYQSPKIKIIDISTTEYLFRDFDTAELETYLKGTDWAGKAGACMVEGFCKPYIKSVKGHESTAMGLSIEILERFIT